MAKGKDKQKSSEKKKPLKTLLEKRKDKKDKKDGSGRSLQTVQERLSEIV